MEHIPLRPNRLKNMSEDWIGQGLGDFPYDQVPRTEPLKHSFTLSGDSSKKKSSPLFRDSNAQDTSSQSNFVERLFAGNLQVISFVVHVLMLAFYATLLASYCLGIAIGKPFSPDKQAFVSTWLTILLQFFGVAQTTLMLFCAQQLAMRSSLMRQITVTGLHDVAQAWSGLGSAIGNLYRQIRHPAALSAPVIAFLYLACIAGLHITTPALFSVEVIQNNHTVPVATQGLINWTQTAIDMGARNRYYPIGQAMLPSVQQVYGSDSELSNKSRLLGSSIGLYGGNVYAVPEDNDGLNTAILVDAVYFGVICGEIGDRIQVNYNATSDAYRIEGPDGFSMNLYQANNSMVLFSNGLYNPGGSDVVHLISTTQIVDASNTMGNSSITLEGPSINYTSVYNEPAEIKSFQILQCTLEPEHRTIGVDPVTKLVRPGYSMTPNITERHFERLNTENEYPWNPMKGTEFEHDASMWKNMVILAAQASSLIYHRYNGQTCGAEQTSTKECDRLYLRTVDEYLMQSLDVYPDVITSKAKTRTQVSLQEVEEVMSNMSAAMYWSELYVSSNKFQVLDTVLSDLDTSTTREHPSRQTIMSEVSVTKLQSRVRLNIIPLAAGFSLAVLLIFLLVPLIHRGMIPGDTIHGLGVLDIVWLSRRHPEVDWDNISNAPMPSTDNLRKLGKDVSVNFSHLLRRRHSEGTLTFS